jgi:hypothetical protein
MMQQNLIHLKNKSGSGRQDAPQNPRKTNQPQGGDTTTTNDKTNSLKKYSCF